MLDIRPGVDEPRSGRAERIVPAEQHARKALDFADRRCVLRRGRVALSGPADEVAELLDAVERAYLASD